MIGLCLLYYSSNIHSIRVGSSISLFIFNPPLPNPFFLSLLPSSHTHPHSHLPSNIHSIRVGTWIRLFIFSSDLSSISSKQTDPACFIGVDGWGVMWVLVSVLVWYSVCRFDQYVCSSFRAGVMLGVYYYYILLLYIIYYTYYILLYLILYSPLLQFSSPSPNLLSSFLFSSSLQFNPIPLPLPLPSHLFLLSISHPLPLQSSVLLFQSAHSFNTCRYLDRLIYIPPAFSTIWPRMFYRSGWLRCVVW